MSTALDMLSKRCNGYVYLQHGKFCVALLMVIKFFFLIFVIMVSRFGFSKLLPKSVFFCLFLEGCDVNHDVYRFQTLS